MAVDIFAYLVERRAALTFYGSWLMMWYDGPLTKLGIDHYEGLIVARIHGDGQIVTVSSMEEGVRYIEAWVKENYPEKIRTEAEAKRMTQRNIFGVEELWRQQDE